MLQAGLQVVVSNSDIIKGISGYSWEWYPLLGSFPYHSHTTPINSWKFMGSLWEPYGKGVPFLGAPGNSLDIMAIQPTPPNPRPRVTPLRNSRPYDQGLGRIGFP